MPLIFPGLRLSDVIRRYPWLNKVFRILFFLFFATDNICRTNLFLGFRNTELFVSALIRSYPLLNLTLWNLISSKECHAL